MAKACYSTGKNPGVKNFKASGTRRKGMEKSYSSNPSMHNDSGEMNGYDRRANSMAKKSKKGY